MCVRVARTETQLAVGIPSPGPERAVFLDRQALIFCYGNGRPVGGRTDLSWVRVCVRVARTETQLTVIVSSPGPERAVFFDP